MAPVATHQPRADQRMRIDIAGTERTAAIILNLQRLAGFEPSQRGAFDIHLVAEHPRMTGAQAALLVALETQRRQGGLTDWRGCGHDGRA